MEFVFPLDFKSSERTYSFSAILISRFTSCLKNRKEIDRALRYIIVFHSIVVLYEGGINIHQSPWRVRKEKYWEPGKLDAP